MVRIILRGSGQITETEWVAFCETILVESPELEKRILAGNLVIGAEVEPPAPTADKED